MSPLGWAVVGSLAGWVYLALGHGRFWRLPRLPVAPPPARCPSVTVVVPARDEAGVLGRTLPTLLAQRYRGPAQVVLVDDESRDGTADLAQRLAAAPAARLASSVVAGRPPEPGWAGKVWALRQGLEAAGRSELVLFTDADIAHPVDSLERLVAWAEAGGYDAVSLMARLQVQRGWERLVVPAFVYFFAQLYPFARVNRAGSRTAAAAGGCLLVRRAALDRAGGLESVRGAVIDDVSLARALKRVGGRLWLGLGDDVASVRGYLTLAELWHMISRSAYTQLRHSPLLLAGTVVGLLVGYAVPPAALVAGLATGDPVSAVAGGAGWAIMAGTFVPLVRYYRQPPAAALLLPVTALLYLLMTLDSARRHQAGVGTAWKGRTYRMPTG